MLSGDSFINLKRIAPPMTEVSIRIGSDGAQYLGAATQPETSEAIALRQHAIDALNNLFIFRILAHGAKDFSSIAMFFSRLRITDFSF